jgi:hypothetical protein
MNYNLSKEEEQKILNLPQEKRVSCEVFSRVVGYFRPVGNWNAGKQAEFKDRLEYDLEKSLNSKYALDDKPTLDIHYKCD